ncbi:hypothetical protein [uncultured Enterococcus sp.]|uniref:hypothetical protein n=1 Tax=uncultured Enterococcus sp. TaxID=167972 RepID=UPI002AA6CA59|nr:hypothetical protein [uncultured Enterococcus sp.]
MGLLLKPAEIKTQTAAMIQAFQKNNLSLRNVLPGISEFVGESNLDGAAWKGLKNQLAAHEAIIQGLIAANDSMVRDSETFSSEVGDEELDEEKLTASIDRLERQNATSSASIENYERQMNSFSLAEQLIESLVDLKRMYYRGQISQLEQTIQTNTEMITELKAKLEALHAAEAATQGLFQEATSLFDSASEGMAAITASFTGSGFAMATTSKWLTTLKKGWSEREELNAIHNLKKSGFTDSDIRLMKELGYRAEDIRTYVNRTDDLDRRKENAKLVIELLQFEKEHPDDAQRVGNFLSPLSFTDRMDIKYLMYTADEPYRTLSMKYLDRFEITRTKPSDGEKSGGGLFSSDGTLYFDIDSDKRGANGRGKFFIFFHELGHAVDYYAGQDSGHSSFFTENYLLNGLNLSGYNEKDVKNVLGNSLDGILSNGNYQNAEQIKNAITNSLYNSKVVSKDNLTGEAQKVYKQLFDMFTNEYFANIDSFGSSDVYHGVTNYDIEGNVKGHLQDSYYFYDKEGNPKHTTGKENFGTYFGYNMVNGSSGNEHLSTYLPESVGYMDHVVNLMK